MKAVRLIAIIVSVVWLGFISACGSDDETATGATAGLTPYTIHYPDYFPKMSLNAQNPLTAEGVALGRKLYYDTKMHKEVGTRACATCHVQSGGFTSDGIADQFGIHISALPHINVGWNSNYLRDGKVQGTIEDIMTFEVKSFFETNVSVLQADDSYPAEFKRVFGTETITQELCGYALAQFFRTLISINTKWDQWKQGLATLTEAEERGRVIFTSDRGGCFNCHPAPLFTDNQFHNNGINNAFPEAQYGRYAITADPADMGKFKTSTLRNIAITGPYMHDKRFSTPEEVIEHYSSGIKASDTLDPIIAGWGGTGLNFTEQEKTDLIAFLNILTDDDMMTDSSLSSPFAHPAATH
jgi:cytochrome c peroxidase